VSVARGYALAAAAAAMWAFNGSLATFLLDDGVAAERLAQLRSVGAFLVLLIVLAALAPSRLRVRRGDVPTLALLGIGGLALVSAAYFVAIDHLGVGPAVTIQYLAPLIVLLWLRIFHGRRLAPSLWGAVALSVAGCFFVVRAYDFGDLDGVGVAAAIVSMLAFAFYVVLAERLGGSYRPETTLVWGFGFATLFWTLTVPWWSFPWSEFATLRGAALGTGVIVVGTLLPFLAMVAALRRIPAARAAVVATLEPALGAVFAWLIHDQSLAAVQIAGGAMVLAAVVWVQSQRPDLQAEAAPALREAR
jgi:drug/metabolite transporter (DMT)-like permease